MKVTAKTVILTVILLTASFGCKDQVSSQEGSETVTDSSNAGKELFSAHCLQCHSDIYSVSKSEIAEVLKEQGEEKFKGFLTNSDTISRVAHRYEFTDEELDELVKYLKK